MTEDNNTPGQPAPAAPVGLWLLEAGTLALLVWFRWGGQPIVPVSPASFWRWGAALVCLFGFMVGSMLLVTLWVNVHCEEKPAQLVVGLAVCALVAVPFAYLIPHPWPCL